MRVGTQRAPAAATFRILHTVCLRTVCLHTVCLHTVCSAWGCAAARVHSSVGLAAQPRSCSCWQAEQYTHTRPARPTAVVFARTFRYSKDFGETLTPVKNPGSFKGAHATVRANRLQPDWLLVLAKRPDCHTLDDLQIRCPNDLFVSKVGARSGCCCDFGCLPAAGEAHCAT